MILVTVEFEGYDEIRVDMDLETWEALSLSEKLEVLDPYDPMREAELYIKSAEQA